MIQFGTAGIRRKMGPGDNDFNEALVLRVCHGILNWLQSQNLSAEQKCICVGYDARHQSAYFAHIVSTYFAQAGWSCELFTEPVFTPLLAFATAEQQAILGIMITASHNPAEDNGMKLFDHTGQQLLPAIETQIVQAIPAVAPFLMSQSHAATIISQPPAVRFSAYLARLQTTFQPYLDRLNLKAAPKIVYSPLHGVGAQFVQDMFHFFGLPQPHIVPEHHQPDGHFPTAPKPNPEEPSTWNHLLTCANNKHADFAAMHDPDADRVLVFSRTHTGALAPLPSADLAVLLADFFMQPAADMPYCLASTVVSSSILEKFAAYHHAQWTETLPGFRWLQASMADMQKKGCRPLLAHEEAIGYSLFDIVADKDGVSTLLAATLMAWHYHQHGKTLHAARDALFETLGIAIRHISCSVSLSVEAQHEVMARWRAQPPTRLGSYQWQHRQDFFVTPGKTMPANIVRDTWQHIQNPKQHLRTMLRPSGTETKLKYYVELLQPLELKDQRAHAEVARLDEEVISIAKRLATNLF